MVICAALWRKDSDLIRPLNPRNFTKTFSFFLFFHFPMIYLPPLTHICLIKASRETADSRLCQRDAISVREHCGGKGRVPVSQAVAQSRSAERVCAVAGQLKRNSF